MPNPMQGRGRDGEAPSEAQRVSVRPCNGSKDVGGFKILLVPPPTVARTRSRVRPRRREEGVAEREGGVGLSFPPFANPCDQQVVWSERRGSCGNRLPLFRSGGSRRMGNL